MLTPFSTTFVAIYWDAPTDTKAARRAERRFRRALAGFSRGTGRIVRGTWIVLCTSPQIAEEKLSAVLPPDGEMRVIGITDKQVGRSRNFWGARRLVYG